MDCMSADGEIARSVIVSGQVQGVFFRDSVRERAEAAAVTGWVRNRSDGRVEALVQGAPEAVEDVIEFCRHGPDRAHVQRVEVSEARHESRGGFAVR
jgi:acylphosphatase